jgi:ribosomal protein S18 acetylase RimI-like enzyme
VEITRATSGDLDALLPLVRGYREFYKQPYDAMGERSHIGAHLSNGSAVIFVAHEDGVAIGFVLIMQYMSTVRLGPALILEDLFVDSKARGSGAADALMDAVIRYARDLGAAGMFLETAMDNARAQAVYERHGWTREERFYKYNAPL